MKFKRTMAMVMATAMMLGLAACGGGSSSGGSSAGGDDEVKIAYIVKAKSDAFWTSMEDGAESFAEEKGIHLEFQAPEKETDVEKQVQMVENAVIKGFDAIVLSAADSNSLAPAIKKANDANIPVILVNDTMSQAALDEAGAHVETYVGIDQYEAASLAGKYAAENIKDAKILYLEGIAGVDALTQRLEGFKDQCGSFKVVASQTAKCDRNEAFNVMQNVLSSNPEVNVVWAVNAEMGQGAIQAIEQGGFSGKVQVFDFDASPDDIEAIKAGTLTGTVAQYPNLQAEGAIQACLDVLDGKTLEERAKVNYDHPAAFDTELLIEHLKELKEGRPIRCPVYSYVEHNRTEETREILPTKVIIVKGILIFQNPTLRDMFDIKIFVETDADVRILRRALRDVEERGRTLQSVVTQYLTTVKPMHEQYVEPSRKFADIIVLEGGRNLVALEMIMQRIRAHIDTP